jgi:hypothetical protein
MSAAMRASATGTETPTAIPMVLPELDDPFPLPGVLDAVTLAAEVVEEPDGKTEEALKQGGEHYRRLDYVTTYATLLVPSIPAAAERTSTAAIIPSCA